MDKLRPALAWLKKNWFWVGTGLITVLMIAISLWGGFQIQHKTDTFLKKVKNDVSTLTQIQRVEAEPETGTHPNTASEEGMKREIDRLLDLIITEWRAKVDAQKDILKWPTEVLNSPEFVAKFSRYNPPETFPEKYRGGHGLEKYLELYRLAIPKQMVRICKELGTHWNYDPDAPTSKGSGASGPSTGISRGSRSGLGMGGAGLSGLGMPGRGGQSGASSNESSEPVDKGAVVWDAANQELWYKKLTEFRGHDDHTLATDAPTPLQVYMLQQDLWLLEAMFQIIRSVNGDVDANDLAAIKRIDHIAFGRDVQPNLGSLIPPDPRLGGPRVLDAQQDGLSSDSGTDTATSMNGSELFDPSESRSPIHGRYVGPDFVPLSAKVVREVLTGSTFPENHLELIVAKRVPVRIALRMDERKIIDFMAASANSPFAFEIHQVRYNRHHPGEGVKGQSGGGSGGIQRGGGSRGGGEDEDMGRGVPSMGMAEGGAAPPPIPEGEDGGGMPGRPMGMGPGGMNFGSGSSGAAANVKLTPTNVETRTNYDVNVEFYGIIKIYNPVRESFLRKAAGQTTDDVNPDDTASQSPPTDGRTS